MVVGVEADKILLWKGSVTLRNTLSYIGVWLLSARILTYTFRVQCMWDLRSNGCQKSMLDHYVSVTFITAGMLLCDRGPWSLLLSLTDMSLFKINIRYVVILILGATAPSATLSPDLQDILKNANYANKHSSSLPVEMGAFSSLKH
jgi:hypothetical protein